MPRSRFFLRLTRAALVLAGLAALAGCPPAQAPAPPSTPFPSVVQPVPEAPVAADEGKPGSWAALDGVEPPARAFIAGSGESARGGVVLVPSVWGTTLAVRNLARALAKQGWMVVVPDIYEGVEATSRVSMKELLAGVSTPRAESLIVAARARLEAELPERPLALVGLGRGASWALGLGEKLTGYRAAAFDTAPLDDETLETLAAAQLPLLALFGDNSSLYPLEKRIALDESAARTGATLVIFPVPGAGAELFDPKAPAFSRSAYDEALARLMAFLDERMS